MRSHDAMRDDEAVDAAWAATQGAAWGATTWGACTGILSGIGYYTSPLYRSLTIQFKVYILMSGMAFGSMIEADRRMRQYEANVRLQRRLARERAIWRELEGEDGKGNES